MVFDSILVVCVGNICRSPLGERLLATKIAERGLDIRVASAGIAALEGHGADEDATAVAAARYFRQIARGQHLHETCGIGAGDFHLPFDGDITQDCVIHEGPEILFRIAEIAWDIHVVIDRKALRAPANGGIKIGGFADLCAETEIFCLHVLRLSCAAGSGYGAYLAALFARLRTEKPPASV
ncbi:MAG: hypothetical protein IKD58_11525 [Loktanella sp.]|nr:hypothetical protein [Loktanella sp.]